MPPKKQTRRIKRWTATDLKLLRQLAGKKSLTHITRTLKRTAAAVRYKAHMHRISLAAR